jgi:NTE family protein
VFRPLFLFPFSTPIFNKFFDYTSLALWHQYSNAPIRSSIEMFAKRLSNGQLIKTRYYDNEPRLLLVSVDIENAKTTTFDSYDTKEYQEGISLNHVIASAAVPKFFAYEEINGQKFWDGAIISNTPLRELLSQHTIFWKEALKLESDEEKLTFTTWIDRQGRRLKIPKVEVCIVNLYPSEEDGAHIPSLYDYDMTKDRENDIRFHDKTEYDLKMAKVVDDYKEFVQRMTDVAVESIYKIRETASKINNKKYKNELNDYYYDKIKVVNGIFGDTTRITKRNGEERYYWHLLRHRFELDEMIKIQREDDSNTISDKIFDFSYATIDQLIKKGVDDAMEKVFQIEKENNNVDTACSQLHKLIEDIEVQSTDEDQYLIEAANYTMNRSMNVKKIY